MISGRCAACKYLRRRCPSHCIFSPYFPPNDPQRFACVHRIYGASNVGKMLQVISQMNLYPLYFVTLGQYDWIWMSLFFCSLLVTRISNCHPNCELKRRMLCIWKQNVVFKTLFMDVSVSSLTCIKKYTLQKASSLKPKLRLQFSIPLRAQLRFRKLKPIPTSSTIYSRKRSLLLAWGATAMARPSFHSNFLVN